MLTATLREPFSRILAIALIALATNLYGQITDHTPQAAQNPEVHIQVRADRPAAQQIPATLFGSFLEPIGRSTYGGLWAELLENGSLEDGLWSASETMRMGRDRPELLRGSDLGLPLPWEP